MNSIQNDFDKYLAGIAWNAWRELGVATSERYYKDCLIQLEELIILTAIISKYDPRLRDEALDWCSRYHEYVSVSRLRAFLKEMDVVTNQAFSQFAADLNAISAAKWPNMEEVAPRSHKLSGKSLLPALEAPPLLTLRLRSLFGAGAKADILTYFLTRNRTSFSASDLEEMGYSKRSLLTALDQLTASGLLSVTNIKNKNNYELKKGKELQVIFGQLPKIAPPWIRILKMISAIRAVIPELEKSTDLTSGIILRNCLIKIQPLLQSLILPIIQNTPNFDRDWRGVMEVFRGFQHGNFFMQYDVHNDFDAVIIQLLNRLYPLVDCVDGLETIQGEIQLKNDQHREVYKECYQLFLSFISDLKIRLTYFLEFPFYQTMDEPLQEIVYLFSKDMMPLLLEKMDQIQPIDQIVNVQSSIRQYQLFLPALDVLWQFTNSFRKRLADLYFIKTDIHLLNLPSKLYKRHLVLELFRRFEQG